MAKDEAIEHLKTTWQRDDISVDETIALEMAIKALEQEPCEDCISRAEVLKLLEKEDWADTVYGVMALPSVTPAIRWIPVTERPPKEYTHVLCQFTLGGMAECYWAHGVFHIVGGILIAYNDVIAWRPLPESYVYKADNSQSKYYRFSDGWFDYFVNVVTGEKKYRLEEGDIEV